MSHKCNSIIQVFCFIVKIVFFLALAGYSFESINCLLNCEPSVSQQFAGLLIFSTVITLFWRIYKHSLLLKQNIKTSKTYRVRLNVKPIKSIRKYCNAIKEMPCSTLWFLSVMVLLGLFKIVASYKYRLNDEHVIAEFEFYICENRWIWILFYIFIVLATLWAAKAIVLYEQNYKTLSYPQKLSIIVIFAFVLGAFFRLLVYSFPN